MRFQVSAKAIRHLASATLILIALTAGAAKANSSFVPIMVGPILILVPVTPPPPQFSAPSKNVSYGYDTLGRLVSVTYSNGTAVTYAYDASGNRTQKSLTCGSSGC